jgi:hypothetical protein
MLPTELLWDRLPDPLPRLEQRRPRWWRELLAAMKAQPSLLSDQETFERRMRRDGVQAIVRQAFQTIVAEQDDEHRGPDAFAEAWRNRLSDLLEPVTVEISGWSTITVSDEDVRLAWEIFDLGCHGRRAAIDTAILTQAVHTERGQPVPTFKFSITVQDTSVGDVIYGVCCQCRVGLLYKISIDSEWHDCGFGRRALGHLEALHPDLVWYTTAQYLNARGFYDRYRQDSGSPWEENQHPCRHFINLRSPRRTIAPGTEPRLSPVIAERE